MLGAIAGDMIGAPYERRPTKHKDFPLFSAASRFTDDTVLTVAVADALLRKRSYEEALYDWGNRYPDAGYGAMFASWLRNPVSQPYNSWGNGSAMRVSPVGWAFGDLDQVMLEAARSAAVTHNHPEGVKGAQAVAAAVFLGRSGKSKQDIRSLLEYVVGYDLSRSLDEIRSGYSFEVSCQASVPEALIAFFEAEDFEDAIRNAVSLGGDADTQACIAGAVAEACYGGVPQQIASRTLQRLTPDLQRVVSEFQDRFKS